MTTISPSKIEEFELHLITDNPWQTRPLDEAHAAELAADVAERGLLQPAVGRIHPTRPEYVQLATGHHRLAAFRLLRQEVFDKHQGPGEPDSKWATFPIDVRVMTDLQMAQTAIAENNARKDLTALEKAQTLQRLIREFNLSQADAGKAFGMTQSGVANLLRLLKLPEPIQAHVQSGALPERLARQLVTIAKVFPQEAQKIADTVAKAEPDARQSEFDGAEEEFVRKKGIQFYGVDWKPAWPPEPIKLVGHKSLAEIPPCVGCEFYRKSQYGGATCLRPECFAAKTTEWGWEKVPAAVKKTGVAAGARDQTYAHLITDQVDEKYIEAVLKSKHTSLVIIPSPANRSWQVRNQQKDLLGSELVTLATSNLQGVWAAVPKPKEKAAPKAQPTHDWKAEQAENDARQKEIDRFFETAAPLLARHIPFGDLVTQLLWDTVEEMWGDQGAWKKSRTPAERAALFVRALMAHKLEENFGFSRNADELKAAREIVATVAKAFGAKLPAGWDAAAQPPAPAKAVAKRSPKSNTAAQQAAAQALVLAAKSHVHGHAHPAPKPSAAKRRTQPRRTLGGETARKAK